MFGGELTKSQNTSSMAIGLTIGVTMHTTAITARMTMLATAARLRRKRRQASAHRLRPLTSSTGLTTGRMTASVMAPSVVTHARIDQAVSQVDQEIGEDDEDAVEDGDAHDQRVVAVERGLDEIPPNPGNAEDLLDDDGSGDRVHHRRPEIGDHRQHG